MEHGHAIEVARAFTPIPDILMHVGFGTVRVEVEHPSSGQRRRDLGGMGGQGLEGVKQAVARGKEDQRPPLDFAQRGRGPGGMENVGRDGLLFPGQQTAGMLVQNDEAGRVRRPDFPMRVIHAGAGVKIQVVPADQDGTVRGIVGVDAGAASQIKKPQNIRIQRAAFGNHTGGVCLRPRRGVRSLVQEWPLIAIAHSSRVQTKDFAPVVDQVNPVAFDRGRRANTAVGPVQVNVARPFRHHQLPKQAPVLFIEAEEHATVALVAGVSGMPVVGADVNAAAGNDGRTVGFRAEFREPDQVAA